MHRNRLFCKECGMRKSKVVYDEKTKQPYAICDYTRDGCGAIISLYQDEYGKWHPLRVENRA